MKNDIRVDISLPRHLKYKRLKRVLGIDPMFYLITFWASVAEQIPNGELTGCSTQDIEELAGWDGEVDLFCSSMIDVGFLDKTEDGYYPHDWHEHQPWVVGAKERSETAKKAGKASALKRKIKAGEACFIENLEEKTGEDGNKKPTDSSTPCSTDSQHNVEKQLNRNPTPLLSFPTPISKKQNNNKGPVPESHRKEVAQLYLETFGKVMVPSNIWKKIDKLLQEYSIENVREAFDKMNGSQGKTWEYLVGILKKNGSKKETSNKDSPAKKTSTESLPDYVYEAMAIAKQREEDATAH